MRRMRWLLLTGACLVLGGAGPTQPQSVTGPCEVRQFFIVAFGTSNAEMSVTNSSQACAFTLFSPALNLVQTAALITTAPRHGVASAALIDANRMAAVTYMPAPGYTGRDTFTATIEPNDKAVIVRVDVRAGVPSR